MAELRAIVGAHRHEIEAADPHIGWVFAGAMDSSVWENDAEGWDSFSERQRDMFDPAQEYEWREITIDVADNHIAPLFIAPPMPGLVIRDAVQRE